MAKPQNDSVLIKNLITFKKKSFDVRFNLTDTNYEPVENIGSGAYGVVCSAIHKWNKKKYAIKKIPNVFDVITTAKRTYREIVILKHFRHENVISIKEILKPPGPYSELKDVYVVMDLMESDLHRIIHSTQPLTEEHIRFFLYQLLRGLKFIHSANVIHRDLKPSNLLVNQNCELKIGDFGMARGISSSTDDTMLGMTQYVATRWYRAPELIMSFVDYTQAVDMWSVGCIFAEMITRKQMFAGRDVLSQLHLIIKNLGTPADEVLKLSCSDIVKGIIQSLGHQDAVSFKSLFPTASNVMIDLIGKLLILDPSKRVTAEDALKHPFLAKYHDPEDEPVCNPPFDFSFENVNMDKESLKKAIFKEIMDYHLPLERISLTPAKASGLPLLQLKPAARGSGTIKLAKANSSIKGITLQKSSNAAPIQIAKPAAGTQRLDKVQAPDPSKTNQAEKRLQEHMDSLKSNLEKHSQELNSQNTNLGNIEFRTPLVPVVKRTNVAVSSLQAPLSDIDMLSAKSIDSVDMISATSQNSTSSLTAFAEANSHKISLPEKPKGKSKGPPKKTVSEDTKKMLKDALLNIELRKQQGITEKRPITAAARQKEREEKRKQKIQKAQERKKKNQGKKDSQHQNAGLHLTAEDKTLLERWKTMQPKMANLMNRVAAAQSLQQASEEQNRLSNENSPPLVSQQPQHMTVLSVNETSTVNPSPPRPVENIEVIVLDNVDENPLNGTVSGKNLLSNDSSTWISVANNQGNGIKLENVGTVPHSFLDQLFSDADPVLDGNNLFPSTNGNYGDENVVQNPDNVNQYQNIPIIGEQKSNSVPSFPAENQSLIGTGPDLNQSSFSSAARAQRAVANHPELKLDSIQSLSKQLSKSQVDETVLPSLSVTPKGTGEGYGVGMDLDDIMKTLFEERDQSLCPKPDSAPLSASLLEDWKALTSTMDVKDLEALETELGIDIPLMGQQ